MIHEYLDVDIEVLRKTIKEDIATLSLPVFFKFGLNAFLAKFVSELRGRGEDASSHVLSTPLSLFL